MKFTTLTLIGLTMLAGCSRRGDTRLIGTWQSDGDRIMAETKTFLKKMSDGDEAAARKIYGHMKRTFTPTTLTIDFNGAAGKNTVETVPYTIIRKDADSVTIKFRAFKEEQDRETTIHFEGPDVFWTGDEKRAFTEYYKRIN